MRMSEKHYRGEIGPIKYLGLGVFAVVVGALSVTALTTTAPTASGTSDPAPTYTYEAPPEEPEPESVVVVGDSNTSASSPDLAAGQIGDGAWVHHVLADDYRFEGGWAGGGATTQEQAEELEAVEESDILVAMTGTNDLGQQVAFDQTASSLDTIAEKASAERVVLLAIPPRDTETTPTSSEFNQSLENLAEDRGWEFFDGLDFLRSPDGGFTDGTTTDGVHLTEDAQREFGENVAAYLGE